MKRFPSYLGPVLILLSVAALIAMVIQQSVLSSNEQQVIRDSANARSKADQRYTHCLVARTLAGLSIPAPDARCVPPTADQARAQARATSPVELLAALARCLEPNRSSGEREACVRAAFPAPPSSTPPTTTTTQPRGGSASRAPPGGSAMGSPQNPFRPPDPFQPTPTTSAPPLVTVPTLPPITLPEVPTTVTLPHLP